MKIQVTNFPDLYSCITIFQSRRFFTTPCWEVREFSCTSVNQFENEEELLSQHKIGPSEGIVCLCVTQRTQTKIPFW